MARKALVTGAAGLLGSHVAGQLRDAGWHVRGLDAMLPDGGANTRNLEAIAGDIEFYEGDCCEPRTIAQAIDGCDTVFHLAARTSHVGSMNDPQSDLHDNVAATLSVLEAARHHSPHARIVLASTRQVFGRPQYLPVDMRHPVCPPDVNAVNKLACEEFLRLYHRVYQLNGAILRFTNIYGPGMRIRDARQNFVGVWIKACLTGEPLLIYGTGAQLRDFVHVEDCARLCMAVAEDGSESVETHLVGGVDCVDLNTLADILKDIAGVASKHVPFANERSAIDIGDFQGNLSEVAERYGWTPQFPLDKGLAQSIEFYRENSIHYLGP